MKHPQDSTPSQYLSTSEGNWRVIYQGMPICADVPSQDQAMAAARQAKLKIDMCWYGDEGVFRPLPICPPLA